MGAHPLTILYLIAQYFILFYLILINVSYLVLGYLGLRSVMLYNRNFSKFALKSLLERNAYQPISIVAPAYNEEKTIVASVRSFLSLHHPTFEVIVVSDGSRDHTMDVLKEAYQLIEVPNSAYPKLLPCQPVRQIYHSLRERNLIVIDKDNGGKADALNAGMNMARYPLVCAVDADSVLNVEALLRTSRFFVEDETVVAVGAVIRPLNGAEVQFGQVHATRIPWQWLEQLQILEYLRSFSMARAGWATLDALLIISGAFGVFKRDAVIEVGGYALNTVGEDMELVVRLHRHYRERKQPYRILFSPDAICWTEVPSDLASLRRQRNRWHRGLWETLWTHRRMLLNPRYGRLGMLAMPYFLIIDALSPIVETLGYIFIPVSVLLNILSPQFALAFLFFSIFCGALLSQMAVGTEILLFRHYLQLRDRFLLLIAGIVESLGYRQLLAFERFLATFQVLRKRGQWGAMKRKGIG